MLAPSPVQAPPSSRGGCSRARPCGGVLILDVEHEIARLRRGWPVPAMWRCLNGHTHLDHVPAQPRMVFRPTCGLCEQPVYEYARSGRLLVNHAQCASILLGKGNAVRKPHRWIEVPANG